MHIKIYDSDSQITSIVKKKKGKENNPAYSLTFWWQGATQRTTITKTLFSWLFVRCRLKWTPNSRLEWSHIHVLLICLLIISNWSWPFVHRNFCFRWNMTNANWRLTTVFHAKVPMQTSKRTMQTRFTKWPSSLVDLVVNKGPKRPRTRCLIPNSWLDYWFTFNEEKFFKKEWRIFVLISRVMNVCAEGAQNAGWSLFKMR